MQKGFTLIEMLVVVLIIGILATVALPQYQRSIERARSTQARQTLLALAEAQHSYFLQNREYAAKFKHLNVNLPFTGTTKWDNSSAVTDTISNNEWSFQILRGPNITDGTPAVILEAGRLTGPYKGAGFELGIDTGPATLGERNRGDHFVCAELKRGNVPFQGAPGSYCEKILKGTMDYESARIREYVFLP